MVLSRRWSVFLVAVGVWSWVIWPRFLLAIWRDDRAWSASGAPTGFFWIHAALIAVSLTVGTAVGVLGIRGWRSARR
ncbi:SCO4848 family membrane protein [Dactylosporangium sp. NPDC048998]|uniref:SCO4848 family membrane protein n=1 Tax=Dactylosporangium sp. NPDC048998 TaxID=3363976 RepID=UPI0037155FDE